MYTEIKEKIMNKPEYLFMLEASKSHLQFIDTLIKIKTLLLVKEINNLFDDYLTF